MSFILATSHGEVTRYRLERWVWKVFSIVSDGKVGSDEIEFSLWQAGFSLWQFSCPFLNLFCMQWAVAVGDLRFLTFLLLFFRSIDKTKTAKPAIIDTRCECVTRASGTEIVSHLHFGSFCRCRAAVESINFPPLSASGSIGWISFRIQNHSGEMKWVKHDKLSACQLRRHPYL